MPKDLTQLQLLTELEPVVADQLDRHLATAKEWHPHDYVPWDEGRNFAALGGVDWDPEQSRLSEVAKVAMITNLLTEDNLPSITGPSASISPATAPGAPGSGAGPPRRTATPSPCAIIWWSPAGSIRWRWSRTGWCT